MYAFQYRKAKTLKEAVEWLAKDEDAKPLSGGMTLLPTLKARLAQPSQLIDIAGLSELAGIEMKNGVLTIGAATRYYQIATSPVVREALPALASLVSTVADPQVRNRGTLGGSVANNDPAADSMWPAGQARQHSSGIVTDARLAQEAAIRLNHGVAAEYQIFRARAGHRSRFFQSKPCYLLKRREA